MNEQTALIDFESRSACSLKLCGSWRYSIDPTTEVLCLAYRLPYWPKGRVELWHPAIAGLPESGLDESLNELLDWVQAGKPLEAHNASFERGIWANILVARYGWPAIAISQWRCSAAKAAAHALPRGLDDAARALKLKIQKDASGAKVMMKMTKPRKPRKAEREAAPKVWHVNDSNRPPDTVYCGRPSRWGNPFNLRGEKSRAQTIQLFETWVTQDAQAGLRAQAIQALRGCHLSCWCAPKPCHCDVWLRIVNEGALLWWETPELAEQLFAYCKQDILVEEAVSAALPDLSPAEQEIYTLDQIINERGFQLDTEAVSTALDLIADETVLLNAELHVLTGGQVQKATQRAQMLEWLSENGLQISDTQKETVDAYLAPECQQPLTPAVRRSLELMRALGRSSTAKYTAMSNHADMDGRVKGGLLYHGASTGRWSGSGVQPHNFPKGSVKDQDALWATLKSRDREVIGRDYKGVMEALSNGLRGAIVAPEGYQLYVADYAGIEARVVQWVAGDEEALDFFRTGGDTYKDMAASIYGVPIDTVTKDQRQLGKVAILGCGFGMGWSKFVTTCTDVWGIPIEDDMAQRTVAAYREKFWRLVEEWKGQEEAAIRATLSRKPAECGYITWHRENQFLYCRLPSGRRLAYPFPEIRLRQTPWGAEKPSLTFMGINGYTRKWERQHTYGGSLVENLVQAIARDIMAEAMVRCEASGTYRAVLTVHDELVAEAPIGAGSVKEFEALVAQCPEWADGCPIAAEGWAGTRYRK